MAGSSTSIFILIFASSWVVINAQDRYCPPSWEPFNNSCYFFNHDAEISWIQASNACNMRGSDLASIHSKEEQMFLAGRVRGSYSFYRYYSIGLNDRDTEGDFKWTDDTPVDYEAWNEPDEPNDAGGEDCAGLWVNNDGKWNDYDCIEVQAAYICKTKSELACESWDDNLLHIDCSDDSYIQIKYANYGRLDRSTCGWEFGWNDNCVGENSLTIVEERCNGKKSCDIVASNLLFGDPCRGTPKYLEVRYSCENEVAYNPTTPLSSSTTLLSTPTTPMSSPTTPLSSPTTPMSSPTTPLSSPTTPLSSPTTPMSSPTSPMSSKTVTLAMLAEKTDSLDLIASRRSTATSVGSTSDETSIKSLSMPLNSAPFTVVVPAVSTVIGLTIFGACVLIFVLLQRRRKHKERSSTNIELEINGSRGYTNDGVQPKTPDGIPPRTPERSGKHDIQNDTIYNDITEDERQYAYADVNSDNKLPNDARNNDGNYLIEGREKDGDRNPSDSNDYAYACLDAITDQPINDDHAEGTLDSFTITQRANQIEDKTENEGWKDNEIYATENGVKDSEDREGWAENSIYVKSDKFTEVTGQNEEENEGWEDNLVYATK